MSSHVADAVCLFSDEAGTSFCASDSSIASQGAIIYTIPAAKQLGRFDVGAYSDLNQLGIEWLAALEAINATKEVSYPDHRAL
jgi:hypothetical protein